MGLKKYAFKIIMIMIVIITTSLCVYSLANYKGDTQTKNTVNQSGNLNRGNAQMPDIQGQKPDDRAQNQKPDDGVQNSQPRNSGQDKGFNSDNRGFPNNHMFGSASDSGTKYAIQIIVYSILFFGVFAFAYYFFKKKKFTIESKNIAIIILTMLATGFLFRISASTLIEGHPFDLSTFKSWATSAANNLANVYSSGRASDYPPVYMYVLWAVGKLVNISAITPYFSIVIKLPSILADVMTSYLVFRLAKKYTNLELSVLLSGFYLFNPAVLINSTVWGQVDSFFTLLVVSAIILLSEEKIALSSIMFTIAVLMKPQGIIFVPVLLFEIIRRKSFKTILKAAGLSLLTATIIILPFALNKGPMWIINLYSNTLGEYQFASVNAFNFFSLLGANYTNDSSNLFIFNYHTWGMIAIVLTTLISGFICFKGPNKMFASVAALSLITGVFCFSSRMHERYLFPAVALAIIAFIYLKDKRLLFLAGGFSLTVYINTHYVLYETSVGVNSIGFDPILMMTSILNVFLFGYLVKVIYDVVVKKRIVPLNSAKSHCIQISSADKLTNEC
ncbi:MAG: hypothetical protein Q8903_06740 [Bacteroidota bacterium]|nr:hypothetical protein [Bacteroidota bacterium]